jgi:hypothetical protein
VHNAHLQSLAPQLVVGNSVVWRRAPRLKRRKQNEKKAQHSRQPAPPSPAPPRSAEGEGPATARGAAAGGRARPRQLATLDCCAMIAWRRLVLVLSLTQQQASSSSSSSSSSFVPHPAAEHMGRWTAPPRRTPSTMVPDGPIAANGDMGVGIGGVHGGNQSFYFGKMDFWSSTAFDGSRHEWTHVAPGFVELSLGGGGSNSWAGASWAATQELYEPRLNTTMHTVSGASFHTSAVFAPEANVLAVRLSSTVATTLGLRLSTQLPSHCRKGENAPSCMADLPMTFGVETGPGAALTMTREASQWVNNEAVLVECDPALIPTMGQRSFSLVAGRIAVAHGTGAAAGGERGVAERNSCLALLPSQGSHSTARGRPSGDHIISIADCTVAGPVEQQRVSGWRLTPRRTIEHAPSGMCAVYSTSNWSVSVFPMPCADAAAQAGGDGLGRTWAHDPRTGFLQALEWAPPAGSVIKGVPQAVPHCLLAAIPNKNISLGMAATLLDSSGKAVPPLAASAGAEPFASYGRWPLQAGLGYVLAVSIETTRTSDVPRSEGALATALRQVLGCDAEAVGAANRKWWERWWARGAVVRMGKRRQVLERFWYGQQYMLGSMSRPCHAQAAAGRCRDGATVPGLLGPWSMMVQHLPPPRHHDHNQNDGLTEIYVPRTTF